MTKRNRINDKSFTRDHLQFLVDGPFEVPVEQRKHGRMIPPRCSDFWTKHPSFQDKRGCYVLAIRAAKGYRPIYVGRTRRSFREECFQEHKIGAHYNPALLDTLRGTPVMFFLVPYLSKGKPNHKKIKDLEAFLIQTGVAANPDLSNVRGRDEKDWGIAGVIRGGKGKPTFAAREFKRLMKISAKP